MKKPKLAKDGEPYDKYLYADGESLQSIARTVSKPWKSLTWQEVAAFNFGTAVPTELNWYLAKHNGCTKEKSNSYVLSSSDARPFLWVPRLVERPIFAPYRSPGRRDVGHVALDDGRDKHINTLRIKAGYLIALDLGDMNAIFDPLDVPGQKPYDSPGVRQRLQALGYLYRPLGHSKIADAAKACWEYYGKVVHKKPDGSAPNDTDLKAILREETQRNIIGMLPGATALQRGEMLDARLPRAGEVGAIRFPGGYTYNHSTRYPRLDHDGTYGVELTGDRHKAEDDLVKDNRFLGKIPLVATVFKVHPDGRREAVEGITVYFQLVKPDLWPEEAAVQARKDSAAQKATDAAAALAKDPTNPELIAANEKAQEELAKANSLPPPDPSHPLRAPKLGDKVLDQTVDRRLPENAARPDSDFLKDGGPKKFIDEKFAASGDAADPQRENCPEKEGAVVAGGKRGLPVAGNIFSLESWDGFHTAKPDQPKWKPIEVTKEATPTLEIDPDSGIEVKRHDHAVRVKTNEDGKAGVIFMPSRIGGDRYKIRVYVGPETLEFDGSTPEGPVIETGTLVVWRNVRLYRYIQMKVGARRPDNVSDAVKEMLKQSDRTGSEYGAARAWTGARLTSEVGDAHITTEEAVTPAALDHFGTGTARRYRPVPIRFPNFQEQLRRCWCELIVDADNCPEPMTDADLGKAVAKGIAALKSRAGVGAIDWDKLIFHDFTSPFLINMRSAKQYNTLKGVGKATIDATNWRRVAGAVSSLLVPTIMDYFSGGGVLPGLTLIQVPCSSTWAVLNTEGEPITSGIATYCRGAYLNYTQVTQAKLAYSVTANTAHELGHVLVRQHAPLTGNTTAQADCHQDMAEAVCVMSYTGCLGEYCGRCVASLRGARVRNSTRGTVTYDAL
jgi:hypothetical protein